MVRLVGRSLVPFPLGLGQVSGGEPGSSTEQGLGSFDGKGRVRAAGGVVWRRGRSGEVEVVVVHRPRYDDWTFPKGKWAPGESDEQTAVREVEEETGLRCVPGRELASASYVDSKGRPKVVRYWEMTVAEVAERTSTDEVDQFRWVTFDDCADLLTYEHDRDVLESFIAVASR